MVWYVRSVCTRKLARFGKKDILQCVLMDGQKHSPRNGSGYLSTNFCPSSVKKNKRFSGFEPETKILLAIVVSLHHHPNTSFRRHKYYIPTYLQARCELK